MFNTGPDLYRDDPPPPPRYNAKAVARAIASAGVATCLLFALPVRAANVITPTIAGEPFGVTEEVEVLESPHAYSETVDVIGDGVSTDGSCDSLIECAQSGTFDCARRGGARASELVADEESTWNGKNCTTTCENGDKVIRRCLRWTPKPNPPGGVGRP